MRNGMREGEREGLLLCNNYRKIENTSELNV